MSRPSFYPTGGRRWVEGYLAQKKAPPHRTLQYDHALVPGVILGGRALSYERGTPVGPRVTLGLT